MNQNLRFGAVMEEPTFSAREEEEEVEEEEEQARPGKEDLALRVDGTTSRERLMGITARVEGTTRPWYSKSLETGEKSKRWYRLNRACRAGAAAVACIHANNTEAPAKRANKTFGVLSLCLNNSTAIRSSPSPVASDTMHC